MSKGKAPKDSHPPHHVNIGLYVIISQPQLGHNDLMVTSSHPPHVPAFTPRKVPEKQHICFGGKEEVRVQHLKRASITAGLNHFPTNCLSYKIGSCKAYKHWVTNHPLCQQHQAGNLLPPPTSPLQLAFEEFA